MEDIVPELLREIQTDFDMAFHRNAEIEKLLSKIQDGAASYQEVNAFAIQTGEMLAEVFKRKLSAEVLPDGRMYYNIASRILNPTLQENYELVADAACQVQEVLNQAAGIGIKAIRPELNQDRIKGLIDRVSKEESFENVKWILDEPVVNFTQSVVDDVIRENADFQYKAGRNPKIIRTVRGGCCEWCAKLAGVYEYSEVSNAGNDVFRRHERCRCTVEYAAGGKRHQNVWSKEWTTKEERDKLEARKQLAEREKAEEKKRRDQRVAKAKTYSLLEFAETIMDHPKILSGYSPENLKKALEQNGYQVKPLNKGAFKNILFEDGGGYKVNFEDGGVIMYHPKERSHHKGEYYKVATGKRGVHRYDTKGEEIT